jgi:tetraacyldisaccharide 4'-kinase
MKSNQAARTFSFETILWGLSLVYGGLARLRSAAFEFRPAKLKQLPCVVISIGNITVGGTGKTPMVIYLARLVRSLGYRVAIVSRGYKGNLEKTGGIVSDGQKTLVTPEASGDEPFMIANALTDIPVVVGQNRFMAGTRAIAAFSPEVIILDDAFQHLQLRRDINLLLVDQTRPFGNRHLLPRGPLREPVSAIGRADVIVETRCRPKSPSAPELLHAVNRYAAQKPVFRAQLEPVIENLIGMGKTATAETFLKTAGAARTLLRGKRVFAFSGVADNPGFHHSLTELGCTVAATAAFPDHHWFSADDVAALQHQARDVKAELIVTTQKDICRINGLTQWPANLVVLGIEHDFGAHKTAFHDLIRRRLFDLIGKSCANSGLTIFSGRVI